MEIERVLQQFRRVRRELLKWENFQTGGLAPLSDPNGSRAKAWWGEQEAKPPEANRFIDFTHL